MKKYIAVFSVVIMLFCAVSCSSDVNIKGRWRTEEYSEELGGTVSLIYEFTSDGKVNFSPENSDGVFYSLPIGTYRVEGNSVEITSDGVKTLYTCKVTEDTVTLKSDGGEDIVLKKTK